MFEVNFGHCECGGKLIPIWNVWEDRDKFGNRIKIRGIDILRCAVCLRDYPAPSDFDVVERIV
jgi:hypothetical protein